MVNVVYFEQLLGAAHSKSKLKNTFSLLFEQKRRKAGKLMQNYSQKKPLHQHSVDSYFLFQFLFELVLKSPQKEAFTGATLKTLFFIWHQFIFFPFPAFLHKKANFIQPLDCPVTKHWSKYSIGKHQIYFKGLKGSDAKLYLTNQDKQNVITVNHSIVMKFCGIKVQWTRG